MLKNNELLFLTYLFNKKMQEKKNIIYLIC